MTKRRLRRESPKHGPRRETFIVRLLRTSTITSHEHDRPGDAHDLNGLNLLNFFESLWPKRIFPWQPACCFQPVGCLR